MHATRTKVEVSLTELLTARAEILQGIAALESSILHSWGNVTNELAAFVEEKLLILAALDDVIREAHRGL